MNERRARRLSETELREDPRMLEIQKIAQRAVRENILGEDLLVFKWKVESGIELSKEEERQYNVEYGKVFKKLKEMADKNPNLLNRLFDDVSSSDESLRGELDEVKADFNFLMHADLLFDVLNENYRNINESMEGYEEMLQQGLMDFDENARRAIGNGTLPISYEELRERLANVEVRFMDVYSASSSKKSKLADYTLKKHVVRMNISDLKDQESFSATLSHELLHAVSGRSFVYRPDKTDEDLGSIKDQKLGLRFHGKHSRFTWMNEAITEDLNVEIRGGKDEAERRVYFHERGIVKLLRTAGENKIPEQILTDAYFENVNFDPKERMAKWKTLRAAINESFYPRFLVDLDKHIEEHGVEVSVEKFYFEGAESFRTDEVLEESMGFAA